MAVLRKNGEELARLAREYWVTDAKYKKTISIRSNGYVLSKTQIVNVNYKVNATWKREGKIKKLTPEVIEKVKKYYEVRGFEKVA